MSWLPGGVAPLEELPWQVGSPCPYSHGAEAGPMLVEPQLPQEGGWKMCRPIPEHRLLWSVPTAVCSSQGPTHRVSVPLDLQRTRPANALDPNPRNFEAPVALMDSFSKGKSLCEGL